MEHPPPTVVDDCTRSRQFLIFQTLWGTTGAFSMVCWSWNPGPMEYSLVYVPFPEVFVRSTGLPVWVPPAGACGPVRPSWFASSAVSVATAARMSLPTQDLLLVRSDRSRFWTCRPSCFGSSGLILAGLHANSPVSWLLRPMPYPCSRRLTQCRAGKWTPSTL